MARVFNGTSDRIDIANEATFDFDNAQARTMACWVYLTGNNGGAILAKEAVTTFIGYSLFLETFSGPVLAFEIIGATNFMQKFTANAAVPQNQWAHVAATYTGNSLVSGVTLYVNGVVPTGTQSNPNVDTLSGSSLNNSPIQIGARGGTTSPSLFFTGRMVEGGVWNSALSAAQILQLANDTAPGTVPTDVQVANLVERWSMRRELTNEPGLQGGNDGTLTGTTYSYNDPVPYMPVFGNFAAFPKSKLAYPRTPVPAVM